MSESNKVHNLGLACAALLALGALGYVEFVRRPSAESPADAAGGETASRSDNAGSGVPPAARETSQSAAGATPKFFALLEQHRNERWLSERMIGIPFTDSPRMWKFFSELRGALGEDSAPTLAGLIRGAQSPYYRDLYTFFMVGIKDPMAETYLRNLALDREAPTSQRELAVYGLGLLATDSAYAVLQGLSRQEDEDSNVKNAVPLAMGRMGGKGTEAVLKEALARTDKRSSKSAGYLLTQVRGADARTLEDLVRTSPDESIRRGALFNLSIDPDSSRLGFLVELAMNSQDPELAHLAISQFCAAVRIGVLDLKKYPEILSGLVKDYAKLPRDMMIALHAAGPLTRNAFPDDLDQLVAGPGEELTSELTQYNYYFALAADPGHHTRLGRYVSEASVPPLALELARMYFDRHGGFSDKDLGSSLAGIVSNPHLRAYHPAAWGVLAHGPIDAKLDALRKASEFYLKHPEEDRMRVIQQMSWVGAEATPVLLDLLKTEPSRLVKIHLASAVLARLENQRDAAVAAKLRSLFGKELDELLDGRTPLGMQYVMIQHDVDAGVRHYAGFIRDLYATFGNRSREKEIRSFADRLLIPEYVLKNDYESASYIRQAVNEVVLESIDEIRSHEIE